MTGHTRWQDRVTLILGMWLFISPLILGFYKIDGGIEIWHSFIMGIAVVIVATATLYRFFIWEELLNLVIGIWLIAAPFMLGFTGETLAMWNHMIVGVLIAADSVWVMLQKPPVERAA